MELKRKAAQATSLVALVVGVTTPSLLAAEPLVLRRTLKARMDSGIVRPLAFSPDGKTIASAVHGRRRIIMLWDVETGRAAELGAASGNIFAIDFSPDGKTLVSGGEDGAITLWRLATGEKIGTLTGHQRIVWTVVFSPDGQTLASASADCSLKLWDVRSGKNIATMQGTEKLVSVEFLPNGKTLASASQNLTVKHWDVSTGAILATFEGNGDGAFPVVFSPDRSRLASTSVLSRPILVWDIRNGTKTVIHQGEAGSPTDLAFSPDGKLVASSGLRAFWLWDVASGRERAVMRDDAPTRIFYSIAFSPDGKTLATGSDDATVKVWDLRTFDAGKQ